MRYAVLFPGQGSQTVGMGEDLFAARPDLLGQAADDVLGWSLRELCSQGPAEDLTRTDKAQPALFALSYALWEELSRALSHPPMAAAGHSLGEYTALAAAGAFAYIDGLRLVAARGRAMDEAARREASGMAVVLGIDAAAAQLIAARRRDTGGRLWVANLNAPGQVVLAGGADDIGWLTHNARDLGVRRVIPLDVAGAFHSPFMAPAATELRHALAATELGVPRFPVIANTTAEPMGDIAETLERQLVEPVRFADSLLGMADRGVEAFVHVGPGDVTAGLAKRAMPGASVVTVSAIADIAETAEVLAVQ